MSAGRATFGGVIGASLDGLSRNRPNRSKTLKKINYQIRGYIEDLEQRRAFAPVAVPGLLLVLFQPPR
jgi:hypothetical protein